MTIAKYLSFIFEQHDNSKWVSTAELQALLKAKDLEITSVPVFRSRIAAIRDKGGIVVSSSAGYKLPRNCRDIDTWSITRVNTVTSPLLARLNKCRTAVLKASNGRIDILDREEFDYLKLD